MMSARGEVYSKYKRGPRTDPCEMPRSKILYDIRYYKMDYVIHDFYNCMLMQKLLICFYFVVEIIGAYSMDGYIYMVFE